VKSKIETKRDHFVPMVTNAEIETVPTGKAKGSDNLELGKKE
jgi:hypothetical protein